MLQATRILAAVILFCAGARTPLCLGNPPKGEEEDDDKGISKRGNFESGEESRKGPEDKDSSGDISYDNFGDDEYYDSDEVTHEDDEIGAKNVESDKVRGGEASGRKDKGTIKRSQKNVFYAIIGPFFEQDI